MFAWFKEGVLFMYFVNGPRYGHVLYHELIWVRRRFFRVYMYLRYALYIALYCTCVLTHHECMMTNERVIYPNISIVQ